MRMQARRRPWSLSSNCHDLGLTWHFAFPQKGQAALLVRGTLGTSTSHVFKSPGSLSAAEAPPFPPSQPKCKKTVSLALLRGRERDRRSIDSSLPSWRDCQGPMLWFPGRRGANHALTHITLAEGWVKDCWEFSPFLQARRVTNPTWLSQKKVLLKTSWERSFLGFGLLNRK